jgi:hypothetical protein
MSKGRATAVASPQIDIDVWMSTRLTRRMVFVLRVLARAVDCVQMLTAGTLRSPEPSHSPLS